MIKILFGLYIVFSCTNLYASALDDLVSQKQVEKAEQKKQAEKQKQQKANKEKEHAQLLEDISDCEQAVAKAIEKRNKISNEKTYVFNSYVVGATKDGLISHMAKTPFLNDPSEIYITDFARDGVFITVYNDGWKRYFIYTTDTDYADNEKFRETNLIYISAGNYKYVATDGSTRSIPAFKAIKKHNVSEINPKTYLQNKELSCCQYITPETSGFKEVGVYKGGRIFEYPVRSPHFSETCKTKGHINGVAENLVVFTGIYYDGKKLN